MDHTSYDNDIHDDEHVFLYQEQLKVFLLLKIPVLATRHFN